jgi:hypothetical protein
MTRPERAVTSWMLGGGFLVFEGELGSAGCFGGDADDGEGFVDEGVGLRGWCWV